MSCVLRFSTRKHAQTLAPVRRRSARNASPIASLSGVNAGRAMLRAYEPDRERAERCLREHLAPMVAEWQRGEVAGMTHGGGE